MLRISTYNLTEDVSMRVKLGRRLGRSMSFYEGKCSLTICGAINRQCVSVSRLTYVKVLTP